MAGRGIEVSRLLLAQTLQSRADRPEQAGGILADVSIWLLRIPSKWLMGLTRSMSMSCWMRSFLVNGTKLACSPFSWDALMVLGVFAGGTAELD